MSETAIPYADRSWNIVTGCTKVSEGCDNCYAATQAATRLRHLPQYAGLATYDREAKRGEWTGEVRWHEDLLDLPKRTRKPTTWFVCPRGDLLVEQVPTDFMRRALAVMADTPRHRYLLVTKRPQRLSDLRGFNFRRRCEKLWLIVTAENQARFDERVSAVCDPASPSYWPGHKGASIEPCLGPIDLRPAVAPHKADLEWVVCGCEKLIGGKPGRPMDVEWARSIRDQCVAAGVPFYFKQAECLWHDGMLRITDANGFEQADKVIEAPFLDGRQWQQVPWKA